MGKRLFLIITGIAVPLVLYLIVSYSMFLNAVNNNEKYTVKQSRILLRGVTEQLISFLNSQKKSLKILSTFRELNRTMPLDSAQFLEKVSFLELRSTDLFVVFDEKGNCVMTLPNEYKTVLGKHNYAKSRFFIETKDRGDGFVSRAVPIESPSLKQTFYYIFSLCPMSNADGSFGGVIGIGFNTAVIFEYYFKPVEQNFDGSTIYITNNSGEIELFGTDDFIKKDGKTSGILPPVPDDVEKEHFMGHSLWTTSTGEKYLIVYYPIDVGNDVLVAQLKIPYSSLSLLLQPFYRRLLLLLIILTVTGSAGIVVMIMTEKQIDRLKHRISELEIQIDHGKKKLDVEQITSTDYFQDLVRQAEILKRQ